MSTPAPLLEADRLALAIGDRWLCREFSVRLEAGECLVLLGPNGAGKTTLLHALAGLHVPTRGEVRLLGQAYAARSARQRARLRALLPQHQPDPFSATVMETALVGRHPHLSRWAWESPDDRRIAQQALAAVGMAEMAGREVLTLSGGERQRVAIATLLAQQPEVFLLDEPLNHLDLHYQVAILGLFRALARDGRGVVMVLHDINLAARFADKVILLDGRGGVHAGRASEVLQAGTLSGAFGHPLQAGEVGGHAVFVPD